MAKVRIRTIDELIRFVEETNLDFDDYELIIEKFTDQKFVWLSDFNKDELIKFLNKHKDKVRQGYELPIFLGNGIDPEKE